MFAGWGSWVALLTGAVLLALVVALGSAVLTGALNPAWVLRGAAWARGPLRRTTGPDGPDAAAVLARNGDDGDPAPASWNVISGEIVERPALPARVRPLALPAGPPEAPAVEDAGPIALPAGPPDTTAARSALPAGPSDTATAPSSLPAGPPDAAAWPFTPPAGPPDTTVAPSSLPAGPPDTAAWPFTPPTGPPDTTVAPSIPAAGPQDAPAAAADRLLAGEVRNGVEAVGAGEPGWPAARRPATLGDVPPARRVTAVTPAGDGPAGARTAGDSSPVARAGAGSPAGARTAGPVRPATLGDVAAAEPGRAHADTGRTHADTSRAHADTSRAQARAPEQRPDGGARPRPATLGDLPHRPASPPAPRPGPPVWPQPGRPAEQGGAARSGAVARNASAPRATSGAAGGPVAQNQVGRPAHLGDQVRARRRPANLGDHLAARPSRGHLQTPAEQGAAGVEQAGMTVEQATAAHEPVEAADEQVTVARERGQGGDGPHS